MISSVPLSKVGKFIRGITFKPDDIVFASAEGSAVCMRTKNVQKDLDEADLISIPARFVKRKEQYLKEGDILVSTANCWELVGKCCWVPKLDYLATAGGFISILRANLESVYPRYLYHWMNSPEIQYKLRYCGRQTTNISNMSYGLAENLLVPLPPLHEQKRIAAILDKADTIRRKRQLTIKKSEDFLRSVFLDKFGDPEKQGWDFSSVEKIAQKKKNSIRTGPFGSQLLHSEFVSDGISVLGIDNVVQNKFIWAKPRYITEEKYLSLKRYTIKPGDVLISIMGTCGRCAIVPNNCPKAINTKHLCCITLDENKCLPEFLHSYFLMHPIARRYLESKSKGAIMDGLNMGIIKELPVPLAPLTLQQDFVALCRTAEKLRQHLEKSYKASEILFNSLTQLAFRGELTNQAADELLKEVVVG